MTGPLHRAGSRRGEQLSRRNSAASLTLVPAGLSPAANCEELSGRHLPPFPTCQWGAGKPERTGGGGACGPARADTLAPSPRRSGSRPSREKGRRPSPAEGPRQRAAPPCARPAANQHAPRERLGLAAHEADVDVGSVPLRVPATTAGGFVGQNFSLVGLLFPPALWWGGGGSSCRYPSSR